MKKIIVTTTINPPSKAIKKFDSMEDWSLVVIGDKKTPSNYSLDRGIYVSSEEQEKYDKRLSDAIGWNCIQRRNFGLLWAHDMCADVVAVIDDDNIPYEGWGDKLMVGKKTKVNYYKTSLPVFDPVGATNTPRLWHRGYPLQLLPRRNYLQKSTKIIIPDIQADFWDGDPDIDAICRMEYAPEVKYDPTFFPLASNKMAPFNSQNTFLSSKVLPNYFLYPHIGRMDDIWAAYFVQSKGHTVVFGKASVYQERNPHNYLHDMKAEYLGYENNLELVESLSVDPMAINKFLPERTIEAWRLFQKHFK